MSDKQETLDYNTNSIENYIEVVRRTIYVKKASLKHECTSMSNTTLKHTHTQR